MREIYQYPAREHIQLPRNEEQQLAYELENWPLAREARVNLVQLFDYEYSEKPFMKTMRRYAMSANGVLAGYMFEADATEPNANFYMGTLAAVHMVMAPREPYRRSVLSVEFAQNYTDEMLSAELALWAGGEHDENWMDYYLQFSENHQINLCKYAGLVFDSNGDRQADMQTDLLTGYTFAHAYIRHIDPYMPTYQGPV